MRKFKHIFLLTGIFVTFVAFNFQDNGGGWYQQFLPNVANATISDMTFTDSLNGYMISNEGSSGNNYILKTTNGGDNWNIVINNNQAFVKIKFLDQNTGFTNAFQKLYKTTNAGVNWDIINLPGDLFGEDMFVLNSDTIWLVNSNGLVGGVFRTTNSGVNWVRQANFTLNPTNIYFYNARIGFICNNSGSPYIRKTTDGGASWNVIATNDRFIDIQFTDSLTGWKSYGTIKKTTNGGINWVNQSLPQHSGIVNISNFSVLNKDTIWGIGGKYFYPGNRTRAVLYTTTNGGDNWYYQVPDTSIEIFLYTNIQFIDRSKGWAYTDNRGIHTKIGGDPLTSINSNISEIPLNFILSQNYPNPFNPLTRINYELQITNYITLKVYNINGKEILTLVNERKSSGKYSVEFDGSNLTSGIYFYTLQAGNYKETKKILLVK